MIRICSSALLTCIPRRYREKIRKKTLKRITKYSNCNNLEISAIETMESLSKPFASDMLDKYIDLPFEDGFFMCFAGWDDHLHRKYGNYTQLPTENERTWKHHPILIDFYRNYDEIPLSERTI